MKSKNIRYCAVLCILLILACIGKNKESKETAVSRPPKDILNITAGELYTKSFLDLREEVFEKHDINLDTTSFYSPSDFYAFEGEDKHFTEEELSKIKDSKNYIPNHLVSAKRLPME